MATSSLASVAPPAPAAQRTGVPWWLFVVFCLSDISGLMYQVVWVRMLGRVLGNTVYATSTVLAAFMAGLALGSYLISSRADRLRRPVLWYAVLEIGIGLAALLTLLLPTWLVPLYRAIYHWSGDTRMGLTAGQVLIALAMLLLPTILMGATLPLLSAFGARSQPSFGRYVGTLYALNTLGAVIGVLASGFVLIGLVGETRTLLIGSVINALAALGALVGGWSVEPVTDAAAEQLEVPDHPGPEQETISPYSAGARRMVALCFAFNGLAALGFEVLWSRMLPIYIGNSIYAFSGMLTAVLSGLVLGSWWGSRVVARTEDPLRLMANVQLLLGLAAAVGLCLFGAPLFEYDLFWHGYFPTVLALPLIMLGPFAFLSGMVFPLAARCYAPSRSRAGQSIGRLYAWNTLGCIAGALLTGFVLIPLLHTSRTAFILAGVSVLLGILLLAVHPRGLRQMVRAPQLAIVLLFVLVAYLSGDVLKHALHRKILEGLGDKMDVARHIEEADGNVTALRHKTDALFRLLLVNGRSMTTLTPVTKLMAHLPLALADEPRDALVICFGMGTTFRSASVHDNLNVTAVELVGGTYRCFYIFHRNGSRLFQKPHLRAVVDDGRNFLLMTQQQYDTITIDPAPPLHSAGTVNLYSREFFQLCKDHLRPGGVMCLWVPPGPKSDIKMILRTYLDVFEHVHVWSGSEFTGFFLIGTHRPLENIRGKIARLYENPAVVTDLKEWEDCYDSPEKVMALHVGDQDLLRPFVQDVPVITDDTPYTEFTLWRSQYDPDYKIEFDARKLYRAIHPR